MAFQWPNKRRIPWLLVALLSMLISAYSTARFFADVASVGALTGLPEYARKIPQIRADATWWEWLAIVLPFVATLLLGFGKDEVDRITHLTGRTVVTYSAESREWLAPVVGYLVRLGLSALGTLGFMVLLLLVGFILYRLAIHAG